MIKRSITPDTYSTVCPYLMVDDVVKQMEFMETLLGAKEKERVEQDGEVIHGEVIIGEVVIMLGKSRSEWPARQSMLYLFALDVDQIYNQAMSMGCTSLSEPGDREYGFREAGFEDERNTQWWIATPLG